MKTKEQLRDEAAEEYSSRIFNASWMSEARSQSFKAGFNYRDKLDNETLAIAVDAFRKIIKSQYGAQGYIEEDDIEGLASYWAQIAISYQDMAREALKKIEKLK